jgi:hypothetical protein
MDNDIACGQCRPLEVFEGIFLSRDYSGTKRSSGWVKEVM